MSDIDASEQVIVHFDDPASTEHSLLGGKGANLGRMTRDGLTVPPGFGVTTVAYRKFLTSSGAGEAIGPIIEKLIAGIDDQAHIDTVAAEVRAIIESRPLPADMEAAIAEAYAQLGDNALVAVRSSGTAEDLAEASFAGQHDTYLNVRGTAEVIDAVRACWASMWSARAVSYRNKSGVDHLEAAICAVVQVMVPSEISGVMFTGNAVSTATDEIVINASWGLGEAIVSGVVTPDEFVVAIGDLHIRERTLGAKEIQMIRNPDADSGTVERHVSDEQRNRFCLTDDQVAELAGLGRRLMNEHYGEIPQDIEWGYADGTFYLLQSRPITGVDFTWDFDVDRWQEHPEVDDTVWTRQWADSDWTGAITPLFYSHRAMNCAKGAEFHMNLAGFPELARMRYWKYWKCEAYYNANLEKAVIQRFVWPEFRHYAAEVFTPPAWVQEVVDQKFSISTWLKIEARLHFVAPPEHPQGYLSWWNNTAKKYLYTEDPKVWAETRMELPDLPRFNDIELERFIRRWISLELKFFNAAWLGFYQHGRDTMWLLRMICDKWYDGPNEHAFTDMMSGSARPGLTSQQNHALWQLSEDIRHSPELRATFDKFENAEFLAELEHTDEGRGWLAKYNDFLELAGARGHADRDTFFPRRVEDPSLDYASLRSMLSAETSVDPMTKDQEVNARRDASQQEIVENLRRKPFGALRAEVFKWTVSYMQEKFIPGRDDERARLDIHTFLIRRCFQEVGRRLVERGIVDAVEDVWFLGMDELFEVLRGHANVELAQLKMARRRAAWDRYHSREYISPEFLQYNRSIDLSGRAEEAEDLPGTFRGKGFSRGSATGIARIVRNQGELSRVRSGDILVCNATDPGWTPVFQVVEAVVTETGGVFSHASCLCREYGMPNVMLPQAMTRITDGARISVDSDSGLIILLDDETDAESGSGSNGHQPALVATS